MSVRKRKWKTGRGEIRVAWVVDYVDQKGTRRLKKCDSKKEADDFQAKARVEVRDGVHIPDRETTTVQAAGEAWIKSVCALGRERTTVDQYRTHLRLHINPFIGATLLSRITIPAVRAFQDLLRENGRTNVMVKRVTVSLGSILADSQERGLVSRNAVFDMKRQRRRSNHSDDRHKQNLEIGIDIPTRDEIRMIIEYTTDPWRPFVVTLIFAGLRSSEIRALRWSDVDFGKAVITVRKRADRYNDVGATKSKAGQRTIPIPPIVVKALREWKSVCPASDMDIVFPNAAGKPQWYSNLIRRGIWPQQMKAGLTAWRPKIGRDGNPISDPHGKAVMWLGPKYYGLHCFRHFFASWCITPVKDGGLGLPPKRVQTLLGHSTIAMTMGTYGHLFPSSDDAKSLAKAERALFNPGPHARHKRDKKDAGQTLRGA